MSSTSRDVATFADHGSRNIGTLALDEGGLVNTRSVNETSKAEEVSVRIAGHSVVISGMEITFLNTEKRLRILKLVFQLNEA